MTGASTASPAGGGSQTQVRRPSPPASTIGSWLPEGELGEALAAGLARVEAELQAAVVSEHPFVSEAAAHLMSAGGKRFRPVLALLAAQTVVLLTLALLLSSVVSPMASGIIAVGLFGATWVAGVVGGIGGALGNEGVERVGNQRLSGHLQVLLGNLATKPAPAARRRHQRPAHGVSAGGAGGGAGALVAERSSTTR